MSAPQSSHILDARALRESCSSEARLALQDDFDSIPRYQATLDDIPDGCKPKNRYNNVLPNPESRVLISQLGNDPTSTFINANHVTGYNGQPKKFIATQGPIPATIPDFWRMVWEEGVIVVVMMTGLMENGRMKCHRYWPHEDGPQGAQSFGYFTVTSEGSIDCGEHIQTALLLTDNRTQQTRTVKHFWYTGWPDHGVPEDSWPVIEFIRAIRAFTNGNNAPILVHCSAGIGRTGTYMAIDIGMQELQNEWRVVDIHGILDRMRRERGGSVQTFVQYEFIHRALCDYITPGKPHSMFGHNQPRDVTLKRQQGEYFGFTLRGSFPSFVVSIDPGGLAHKKGILLGDHVLAVNNEDVREMEHRQVVEKVKRAGDTIVLTVLSKTPY